MTQVAIENMETAHNRILWASNYVYLNGRKLRAVHRSAFQGQFVVIFEDDPEPRFLHGEPAGTLLTLEPRRLFQSQV